MVVSLSLLPFLKILTGGPQVCPSHLVCPTNPVRNTYGLYWQDACGASDIGMASNNLTWADETRLII